jgi:phosphoribosylformimino-5-aminoimidazole carboxamide ribotide isomerase
MQIIPVIDLRDGAAVHAKAGDRAKYQPVQHSQVRDGDVGALAIFYARRTPSAIYVADLDAIGGAAPQVPCWTQIVRACDAPLWIDAGIRNEADLDAFLHFQSHCSLRHRLVIGAETLTGAHSIGEISKRIDPQHIVLSLDRRDGVPLGSSRTSDAEKEIVKEARDARVRAVITLDLAAVGVGRATDFFHTWQPLMLEFADLQWYLGGGVKGPSDLIAAKQIGYSGVLSATAILQGAL